MTMAVKPRPMKMMIRFEKREVTVVVPLITVPLASVRGSSVESEELPSLGSVGEALKTT